jgi:hypothetical protein
MDEVEKAAIRRWAERRFRRTLFLLPMFALIFVGLWGFEEWYSHIMRENGAKAELSRDSMLLTTEWTRRIRTFARDLIAFPPPADSTRRAAWAADLENHFGQSVAVFVLKGLDVTWVRVPTDFTDDFPRIDHSLRVDTSEGHRGKRVLQTFGGVEIHKWWLNTDPNLIGVWMAGYKDSSTQWGVAIHYADSWPAFFKSLSQPVDDHTDPASPAYILRENLALSRSVPRSDKTGLRAIWHGKVLFESPDLDTTRIMYSVESSGLTTQFYQSKLDKQIQEDHRSGHFRLLYIAVLLLVFLVPLHRSYKRIMLLTEPERREPVAP